MLTPEQAKIAQATGLTPEKMAALLAEEQRQGRSGLTPEQAKIAQATGLTPEKMAALLAEEQRQQARKTDGVPSSHGAAVGRACAMITAPGASFRLAALSQEIDDTTQIQITPAQDFTPSDGRLLDVPAWRIDAGIAAQIIARFNPAQPAVIDYEHQTMNKEKNGQPAPAAGWIRALVWIDGVGLHAKASFTERARQLIQAGEYQYFSPVIEYSQGSGVITRILMGALTNFPAISGMRPLKA